MARSVQKTFKGAGDGTGGGGGDDELLKQAQEIVRANHETMRQNLLHLQSLEMSIWNPNGNGLTSKKARDVSVFDRREIASINQRYDRQQQRLEQKQNGFWGKMHRLVGGHKSQQRQVARLNAERDRVVTERTAQQVRSEGQRQRSLTERDVRVEKDIQQAREKHSEAREKQRQSQEQGFDHAVSMNSTACGMCRSRGCEMRESIRSRVMNRLLGYPLLTAIFLKDDQLEDLPMLGLVWRFRNALEYSIRSDEPNNALEAVKLLEETIIARGERYVDQWRIDELEAEIDYNRRPINTLEKVMPQFEKMCPGPYRGPHHGGKHDERQTDGGCLPLPGHGRAFKGNAARCGPAR